MAVKKMEFSKASISTAISMLESKLSNGFKIYSIDEINFYIINTDDLSVYACPKEILEEYYLQEKSFNPLDVYEMFFQNSQGFYFKNIEARINLINNGVFINRNNNSMVVNNSSSHKALRIFQDLLEPKNLKKIKKDVIDINVICFIAWNWAVANNDRKAIEVLHTIQSLKDSGIVVGTLAKELSRNIFLYFKKHQNFTKPELEKLFVGDRV